MRSWQATSITASAVWVTSPARPYSSQWNRQASRSTSKGSMPTTWRAASSWMQASRVSVLLTMRASPTPRSPSSVTSSTKVSSRHGVPTTTVSTPMTFTVAPPARR
jgi:hypothetical protein